jgi:hypothetical protein
LTLAVMAVPWHRRLVAGLSSRRPGFDPASVHVRFMVDKVALGQVFFPKYLGFACQFHATGAPLHGKTEKIITGLHEKPQGCGASVASAAGALHHKKNINSRRSEVAFTLVESRLTQ